MLPLPALPAYANANVSESTLTRELDVPLDVSCSRLFSSVITSPVLAYTSEDNPDKSNTRDTPRIIPNVENLVTMLSSAKN